MNATRRELNRDRWRIECMRAEFHETHSEWLAPSTAGRLAAFYIALSKYYKAVKFYESLDIEEYNYDNPVYYEAA